jgi:hypothetical protein
MDRLQVWSNANSHQEQEESTVNDKCNPSGYLWSLLDALNASRQLEASEPKDHICAFLGHPSAFQALTGELIVNPDYTIGWLEWTQDLNIFRSCNAKMSVPRILQSHPGCQCGMHESQSSVQARQARPHRSCSNIAGV